RHQVPAFLPPKVSRDRLCQFQPISGPHSSSHAITMDESFPVPPSFSLRTDSHGSDGSRSGGASASEEGSCPPRPFVASDGNGHPWPPPSVGATSRCSCRDRRHGGP